MNPLQSGYVIYILIGIPVLSMGIPVLYQTGMDLVPYYQKAMEILLVLPSF